MTAVTVTDRTAHVEFNSFDREAYELFLRCKQLPEVHLVTDREAGTWTVETPARFAEILGADADREMVAPLPISDHLFDYQRWIVKMALDARRYAVWADTGLGKTAILLEWARQVTHLTDGGVLILTGNQIVDQTVEETHAFYGDSLPITKLDTRADVEGWCGTAGVAISNHEKLRDGQMPELRRCAGLVLDESSILKSGGGVTKWNLIHSAKGIEFKLSLTATPAPNDTMEYASQASFLERLRSGDEIVWTYFSRDKRGNWRVKPHAREAFYRFMAGWSIYLRDPAAYGFADILATLPPPEIHHREVDLTDDQLGRMQEFLAGSGRGLFSDQLGVRERAKLGQIARGFLYDGSGKDRVVQRVESAKPAVVADLVRQEVAAGRPTIVWTVFDEEAEIIVEHLDGMAGVESLHGNTPKSERAEIIERFRQGPADVLVTKASLVGYGLNFQRCQAMVFSGIDDSYERMYQAIRRAYRFGQTETVHVHVPVVPELEGAVADNVAGKQSRHEADVAEQEANYRRVLRGQIEE